VTEKLVPGTLPADAPAQLQATIDGWKKVGVVTHYQILGPPDCEVSKPYETILFALDEPFIFPFAGCNRKPCCACGILAVLDDEGGENAKPVKRGGK